MYVYLYKRTVRGFGGFGNISGPAPGPAPKHSSAPLRNDFRCPRPPRGHAEACQACLDHAGAASMPPRGLPGFLEAYRGRLEACWAASRRPERPRVTRCQALHRSKPIFCKRFSVENAASL